MKTIFFSFILIISIGARSQSISPDGPSFGFIVWDKTQYVGTAFVLKSKRIVITCAHVIDSNHEIYYASGGLKDPEIVMHKLKIVKLLPQYDLALLESETDLCNRPFVAEKTFNIHRNQHMFYLGYSTESSSIIQKSIQANNLWVISYGKTFELDSTVNYIEFNGVGVPGYSGGPVLNDKGRVIAIMREAWFKQSVRGGPSQLMNRAYSILPILK